MATLVLQIPDEAPDFGGFNISEGMTYLKHR